MKQSKLKLSADPSIIATIEFLVQKNNLNGARVYVEESLIKQPSAELGVYFFYLGAAIDEACAFEGIAPYLRAMRAPISIVEKLLAKLTNQSRFEQVIYVFSLLDDKAKSLKAYMLHAQAAVFVGEELAAKKSLGKVLGDLREKAYSMGVSKLALKASLSDLAIECAEIGLKKEKAESQGRQLDIALAYKQKGDVAKAIDQITKENLVLDKALTAALIRLYVESGKFVEANDLLSRYLENHDLKKEEVELKVYLLSESGRGHELLDFIQSVADSFGAQEWYQKLYRKTLHDLGYKQLKLDHLKDQLSLNKSVAVGYAMSVLYEPCINEHEVFSSQVGAASFLGEEKKSLPIKKKNKIRIGYISSDFRNHSVFYFISPVLSNHSKDDFEIYAYYSGTKFDSYTTEIKNSAAHWRVVTYLNTYQCKQQIMHDQIDILIDLNGHTKGSRLDVFADRSAPIQATWIGYPASTGLKNIDYRMTSLAVEALNKEQEFYSEQLLSLNNETFLIYQPEQDAPGIEESPFLKNGRITFGSFNNYAKIDKATLVMWSKILSETPDSHIVIKNQSVKFDSVRDDIYQIFLDAGIDKERVQLIARDKTKSEHYKRLNNVDIALDTHPYSGTTTTLECLWMGLPVVTMFGEHHRSRVSAMFIKLLGLNKLCVKNEFDYIQAAVNLASNKDELIAIRHSLRSRLRSSPVMDYKGFMCAYEKKLKQIFTQ